MTVAVERSSIRVRFKRPKFPEVPVRKQIVLVLGMICMVGFSFCLGPFIDPWAKFLYSLFACWGPLIMRVAVHRIVRQVVPAQNLRDAVLAIVDVVSFRPIMLSVGMVTDKALEYVISAGFPVGAIHLVTIMGLICFPVMPWIWIGRIVGEPPDPKGPSVA